MSHLSGLKICLVLSFSYLIQIPPSFGQPASDEGTFQMTGKLVETEEGALVITPQDTSSTSMTFTQDTKVPYGVLQLPILAEITKTPRGVELKNVKLEALARLEKLSTEIPEVGKAAVDRAIAQLNSLDRQLRGPATLSVSDQQEPLENAQRNLIAAHDAVSEVHAKTMIAKEFSKIERTKKEIIDKARYGHDDRYYPVVYQSIYANSKGSLALSHQTRGAFCSGVLIGKSLALTALHCVKKNLLLNEILSQTTAVFDYEIGSNGQPLEEDRYPIERLQAKGKSITVPNISPAPELDFALLVLGPNSKGKLPGDKWPPQCLTKTRAMKDDPIYIVGHPQGGVRMVHDNTLVRFPFTATEHEYDTLRLLVEAEAFERGSNGGGNLMNGFTASYRKRILPTQETIYENFSTKFDNQPTIGVDSDTYEGNSGSPAYNRRTGHVVGILIKGAEDRSASYVPGWKSHEAVLPIPQVIDQLDASFPQWRQQEGVCIK